MDNMVLPLILGKKLNGDDLIVDLTKLPHLLIGGLTGYGKSNLLINIIDELAARKSPDEVKFLLIDPKMVEFTNLAKRISNYIYRPVESYSDDGVYIDIWKAYDAISALYAEMEYRYTLLRESRCRSISEFNSKNEPKLPYIVLVIDEYSDLMYCSSQFDDFCGDDEDEDEEDMSDNDASSDGKDTFIFDDFSGDDEDEDEEDMSDNDDSSDGVDTFISDIVRLAQKARAVGIHVILSTQRPCVNNFNGFIKANYPARIAFKVQNKRQSRTVLDESGAEQLESPGDFIYSTSTISSDGVFTHAHAPLCMDYRE